MVREVVELESDQQYTKTVKTTSDYFFQGDAFFLLERYYGKRQIHVGKLSKEKMNR